MDFTARSIGWRLVRFGATLGLLAAAFPALSADAMSVVPIGSFSASQYTRQIASVGTTTITPGPSTDGIDPAWPEFVAEGGADPGAAPYAGSMVDLSLSGSGKNGSSAKAGKKAKSNPLVNVSLDGINHRQQRLASSGNQFSLEPPDQGLCVGNGYVMETVNDALAVYSTTGSTLLAVTALNSFYGYAPAINRSLREFGPFLTDPSCYFDLTTQRWFHVVLTLDTAPNNATFLGSNHLDVAVSQTSSPTDAWTLYQIPVQDDGTSGTPNHGCSGGPCLGDYPHIGADQNGFYITTNEYSLFGPEYKSAQIYAFSKTALTSGAPSVSMVQFDTTSTVKGNPGFTVWPATSAGGQYETGQSGTEYFMSSDAAEEANGTGVSSDLIVWALTNTQSLNNPIPALTLSNLVLTVNQYVTPPKAVQKVGDFPLGQCLDDSTIATPFGSGCWRNFFVSGGPFHEVESQLDSNDTRMQQVVYANGKLWGALDTAVTVNGTNQAAIEWFILKPTISGSGVSASIALQGYLALADTSLTYPAIGVTPSGRGVIAFTLVGKNDFPSAAYASLDAKVGAGDVSIVAAGAGPADGFTSYAAFVGSPPRTRWGDYGAAVTDGNTVWIASEYIAPAGGTPCTLTTFTTTSPLFSCGGTRSSLANWSTRITQLTP